VLHLLLTVDGNGMEVGGVAVAAGQHLQFLVEVRRSVTLFISHSLFIWRTFSVIPSRVVSGVGFAASGRTQFMLVLKTDVKEHSRVFVIPIISNVSEPTLIHLLMVRLLFNVAGVHVTFIMIRANVNAGPALDGTVAVEALLLGGRLL
jgi:hypothetical protein